MVDAADSKSVVSDNVLVRVQSSAIYTDVAEMADAIDSGSIPARGAGSTPVVSILKKYDLLCFDFDGLLVNTEELHFHAYREMLVKRNCVLCWDFATYCSYAHADRFSLRDAVCTLFPKLWDIPWESLRAEKQIFYEQMIRQGGVFLMPGVQTLLRQLQISSCKYCVVTNSPNDHLEILKEQIPLLQTIPVWIGRNEYVHPKPHPDPYLSALRHFPDIPKKRAVAFEDSLKGAEAALAAGIDLIFISALGPPHMLGVPHFSSIEELYAPS